MIAFWECDYSCLWRLDTQEIVPLILDIGYDPPAIINSSHTNQIFVPRDNTMEMGGLDDRFKYDVRDRASEHPVYN